MGGGCQVIYKSISLKILINLYQLITFLNRLLPWKTNTRYHKLILQSIFARVSTTFTVGFVVKRTQSFSQFTWLAVVVKLCHKTTFLDFLVVFSLQYILQKLPVQATRPKITNLKKVFASYCLKQDIVLRITNAQLISRFMFAYKQGFFFLEKVFI